MQFQPADLTLLPEPFDHDDYLFELKMDGFRALAYVGEDETRLVSRRGIIYKRFTELAAAIHIELDCEAVLDGEIVCLDSEGRPQFRAGIFVASHRGTPTTEVRSRYECPSG